MDYLNIRQSYTGGAVDVYIPKNKDNELLYYYDVNGLYPSVMLNNPMPTGQPVAFLGDIRQVDPNAFGFFYCKITSPEYLEHPILQRSIKIDARLTTVAGLGSWKGWVFSAEMDNAINFGYHFEILKGYQFQKGYIFKDYINKMYNLRLLYPKGEAMNLNAKLLMNSLYGKFGMKSQTTKVEIISTKDINKYLEKFNTSISEMIYLEDHIILNINTNEFIKTDLFSHYVHYFYEIKSSGVEKMIAKLLLNNLYGYFGRKPTGIVTQNIKNSDLQGYLLTRIIKSITPINSEYSTILSYSNINYKLLEKLNNELHYEVENFNSPIKSNVAIAAAVTAYARIHMIPFKIDPNTLYTDTDSIFTLSELDPELVGDELGKMKDELKGGVIKEALFLGPKKYGYYIFDKENVQHDFSVFSGVSRNSLTFEEVKNISNGKVITKNVSNRFFKSFNSLNIDIKDTLVSIKITNSKKLVGNNYIPITLHNGYHNVFKTLFNKYKNLLIKNIKKYL